MAGTAANGLTPAILNTLSSGIGQTLVDYTSGSVAWTSDEGLATIGLAFSNIDAGTYALEAYAFLNDCGGGGVKASWVASNQSIGFGATYNINLVDATHVGEWGNSTFIIPSGSLNSSSLGAVTMSGILVVSSGTNSGDLQFAQAAASADVLTIDNAWIKLTRVV